MENTSFMRVEEVAQELGVSKSYAYKIVQKLNEELTRKFLENAFREGEIKTAGTDIDKIMPPVSRFGGGNRAQKKQTIIDKLKAFFEKYFGVGGSAKFTEVRTTSPLGVQQDIRLNDDRILSR